MDTQMMGSQSSYNWLWITQAVLMLLVTLSAAENFIAQLRDVCSETLTFGRDDTLTLSIDTTKWGSKQSCEYELNMSDIGDARFRLDNNLDVKFLALNTSQSPGTWGGCFPLFNIQFDDYCFNTSPVNVSEVRKAVRLVISTCRISVSRGYSDSGYLKLTLKFFVNWTPPPPKRKPPKKPFKLSTGHILGITSACLTVFGGLVGLCIKCCATSDDADVNTTGVGLTPMTASNDGALIPAYSPYETIPPTDPAEKPSELPPSYDAYKQTYGFDTVISSPPPPKS